MHEWSEIKCLIFDLDDTLVNSTAAYEVALGVVGLSTADPSFQKARNDVKHLIGAGHVSARNRLLYFKRMLENQGKFTSTRALSMMSSYEEALEIEIRRQWKLLGRDSLMESLAKRVDLGIVSNENTRTQLIKLRAMDPDGQYFKWVVFSEDVGVEKPQAKIFQRFLDYAGVPAAACLMIGDSISDDIEPARRMGIKALQTIEFKSSSVDANVPGKIEKLESLTSLFHSQ